jgi:glycerol-3-phosphate dehydrogenase
MNATGVWTDETLALAGTRGQFHVRTEKSVLFVAPWGRHWIIGTTDTDWDVEKAHPAASAQDIDYLLDHVNRASTSSATRCPGWSWSPAASTRPTG